MEVDKEVDKGREGGGVREGGRIGGREGGKALTRVKLLGGLRRAVAVVVPKKRFATAHTFSSISHMTTCE